MKRKTVMVLLLLFFAGVYMRDASPEEKKIRIFNAETNTVEEVAPVVKTEAEWKKVLSPEEYSITRGKGTEAPFTGKCEVGAGRGLYKCVACGTDLFRVDEKFESGTGWPSFWKPVSELNIKEIPDTSHGMKRTEVACARCDAHLGHVFDDGPPPTHKRYCINAAALKFVPFGKEKPKTEKAEFAAGCFWGVEESFRTLKGVVATKAGYEGGRTEDPSYEEVCTGRTGYAETVEVEYDPSVITYKELLDEFWEMHDPTTVDRQGPDVGTQYRSVIFYHDDAQKKAATSSREKLEKSGKYKRKIATEIVPADKFYPAEDYHQKYYMKKGIKACPR